MGKLWQICVNNSSCHIEGGVEVYVAAENGTETYYPIILGFKVTNNKAEHKAVLVGLAIEGAL